MVLLNAEYLSEYGGRLAEGTELMVSRTTAERWIEHGVARAGVKAPTYFQEASAKRMAERQQRQDERARAWDDWDEDDEEDDEPVADGSWHEDISGLWYRPTQWETQSSATMNEFMRRFALGED
jgi:hypothetical protein